jgi:alkylation response protein AidB-like acyl-CoA dehydrogenase
VHLAQTERQQQLCSELRSYFRDVMPDGPPPDDETEQRRLLRRIGADGMLGLGWPVEYGGWGLITNQLNHERVALAAIGMQAEDFYEAALDWARTPDPVTGERRMRGEVQREIVATMRLGMKRGRR